MFGFGTYYKKLPKYQGRKRKINKLFFDKKRKQYSTLNGSYGTYYKTKKGWLGVEW